MREWLEAIESSSPEEPLPLLAFLAGSAIDLGDEAHGATRRGLLLLAAGGDPNRGLELDGRAVTAVAGDLDDPARRAQLEAGLRALAAEDDGLPQVAAALDALRTDADLAWRAYAAGVLAAALGED